MSDPIIICIIFLGFSPVFTCIFLGLFINYNFGLGGKLRGVTAITAAVALRPLPAADRRERERKCERVREKRQRKSEREEE